MQRGFRGAEHQIPVGLELGAGFFQHAALHARPEINQHIAQQNQVELRQFRPRADQVEHPELHRAPDFVPRSNAVCVRVKILRQQRRGQPARGLGAVETPGPRPRQRRLTQVGGDDFHLPIHQLRKMFAQQNRQTERLLPRRGRRGPEVQSPRRRAPRDQFRQHHFAQRLVRMPVAEERSLLRRQRLDRRAMHAARGVRRAQMLDELRQRGEAVVPRHRGEARLEQVLAAILDADAGQLLHQLPQISEIVRGHVF